MPASVVAAEPSTDERAVPVVIELQDSAEWYVDAIVFLSAFLSKQPDELVRISSVGQDILQHTKAHLERRLRAYLCPSGLPRTEQQAMAMLKGLGHELAYAAKELDAAAQALKFAGKGNQASHTKQAATRVKDVAEGLLN